MKDDVVVSGSEANEIYGKLKEGAHIAGYSFARVCAALEWLLTDGRWKNCGSGFGDKKAFMESIKLAEFKQPIEARNRLAKLLQEEVGASNRQIAKALGVSHTTIDNDLAGNNLPDDDENTNKNNEEKSATGNNLPPDLSGADVAKLADKRHRDDAKLARRAETHQRIVGQIVPALDNLGPFPLIYADPPWVFETYTPERTFRMPDDHYPTLTDEQIIAIAFGNKSVPQLASDDAALFMWCTSSNLVRALAVLQAWGFEYKSQAVWDKQKIGLGLIFRNQHEILLYGSRGNPPKPLHLPSSVFRFPRTEHSAKPPEIRSELENMYPHYSAEHRVELFARGQIHEWSCLGYEAR